MPVHAFDDGKNKVDVHTTVEINNMLDGLTDGKQDQHTTATGTLTVSGWSNNSQTVTISDVTASNTVIVSPIPADVEKYGEAGIKCTAQGINSLTFTCADVPTANINVNIVVLGV